MKAAIAGAAAVLGLVGVAAAVILSSTEPESGPATQPAFIARFEVTSGDWSADATGARTTSRAFRARSKADEPADVRVALRFRIGKYEHAGPDHKWDGVHVGLRYASPDDLYYVSLARRDGTVAIKRKQDGRYETLRTATLAVTNGSWHDATVTTATVDGGVAITLSVDGTDVLTTVDKEPLTADGRVSLRSDNADVRFANVKVSSSG
jgi:hypothetical protein